jgi:hypothetical protein
MPSLENIDVYQFDPVLVFKVCTMYKEYVLTCINGINRIGVSKGTTNWHIFWLINLFKLN